MRIKDKRKERLLKELAAKKKAEEALQASEEWLRMTTSQLPAILWTTDTELKFTSSTGAGLDALGLKTDQVVGMTLFEYLQTDDPENLAIKAYRQAIKGNTANYEFEWKGQVFDCHVKPMQNKEGSIIGTIGFALDITKRKKAEMALRESERKYKDLQDASIDGHAWTDMEGHLIEVNDAYKNMMGYSEDELRKLDYKDITPEQWHAFEHKILTEQIMARGYSDPYEKELIRKDGTTFPVELRAYLIKDSQGNNIGMRASVIDITERRKAEDSLKESEEFLKKAQEIARLGHWKLDPGTGVIEGSDELFRIFGLRPDEVTLDAFAEAVHPDDRAFDLEKIRRGVEHGEPWDIVHRLLLKDGTLKWVNAVGEPILDETGKTKQLMGTVQDITERKKAEEKLKEYSQRLEMMVEERTKELREAQEQLVRREKLAALGQIAGSIGHELRNPLGVIGNSAFYLKTKFKDEDEKVMRHLDILRREIRRSDAIISDLLDFSRVLVPSLKEIDVNRVIKDTLAGVDLSGNINLETRLDESLPVIKADPGQIQQVFQNIILNAVQAMPEGGSLEITTGTKDGFVVTVFKDTGGGISEENIRKIFEPLFTTKVKGIGLGLSIVKSIIDGHKGEILVESEVGKGTAVTVKLMIDKGLERQ